MDGFQRFQAGNRGSNGKSDFQSSVPSRRIVRSGNGISASFGHLQTFLNSDSFFILSECAYRLFCLPDQSGHKAGPIPDLADLTVCRKAVQNPVPSGFAYKMEWNEICRDHTLSDNRTPVRTVGNSGKRRQSAACFYAFQVWEFDSFTPVRIHAAGNSAPF